MNHPMRRAGDTGVRRVWRIVWPVVVGLAVGLVVLALFYTATTVHAHNAGIDCLKADVNQLINELNHHEGLRPPPNC